MRIPTRSIAAASLLAAVLPAQASSRALPDATFADTWNLVGLATDDFQALRGSTLLIEIWRTW
jgi:hypothetical protein